MNLDDQMKKEEDEEDIALANFIESLQKQTDEEIFQNSNLMIAVSYLMKRKIKNIFLEVISNTKIIYNFVQWFFQQPRFCQTYRGVDKEETGQREYGYMISLIWTIFSKSRLVFFCILQKIYCKLFKILAK